MSTASITIARNNVSRLSFTFAVAPISVDRFYAKYELDYWTNRLNYLLKDRRCKRRAKLASSNSGASKIAAVRSRAIDTCARDAYHVATEHGFGKLLKLQARK